MTGQAVQAPPSKLASPFLKWAGGKNQLLGHIDAALPLALKDGHLQKYVEPFLGGGAVFFHIAQHYAIETLIINDINPDLVLAYRSIQQNVDDLIERLYGYQSHYTQLDEMQRKAYFYTLRNEYNAEKAKLDFGKSTGQNTQQTARMIFLNRTCFNGLFRVNASGHFNVPFGKHQNPLICAEENLRAVSQLLQRTDIHHEDYQGLEKRIDDNTFVYFDPPYRPLNKTAHFTAYSKHPFDDAAQLRLAAFYKRLDQKGALLMLSNSDPHNEDPTDNFFETAYADYTRQRVPATRMINANAKKRGPINELLIVNY